MLTLGPAGQYGEQQLDSVRASEYTFLQFFDPHLKSTELTSMDISKKQFM